MLNQNVSVDNGTKRCGVGQDGGECLLVSEVVSFLRVYESIRRGCRGCSPFGERCLEQGLDAVFAGSRDRCGCGGHGGGVDSCLADHGGRRGDSRAQCVAGDEHHSEHCTDEDSDVGSYGQRRGDEFAGVDGMSDCRRERFERIDSGDTFVNGGEANGDQASVGAGSPGVTGGDNTAVYGSVRFESGGVRSMGSGATDAQESAGDGAEKRSFPEVRFGGDGGSSSNAKTDQDGKTVPVVHDVVKGKNYEKNKARRAKQKERLRNATKPTVPAWRVNAKGNFSSVDSRFDAEARETLAERRVYENRVAIAKAKKLMNSFGDATKTEALSRLEVARIESRINTAKLRSQEAYNKQDKSLKSAGSATSAGEFAMKKVIAENATLKDLVENQKKQMDVMMKHAPKSLWPELCAVPEARKFGIRDVLGEPNETWNKRETNAYYKVLNAEAIGDFDTPWEDFL